MATPDPWPDDRLPTLDAARLRLRWLERGDVPALFRVFSNVEVMTYWSRPPMLDVGEAETLLADIHSFYAARSLAQWGIALRESDEVIGTTTLFAIDRANARAEIGFALGREHWGHGYAREAVSRVIDFAFGPLGLARLEADVDPNNARSLKLVESLGFVREGLARERWRVGGGVQDAVLLGLLARERRGGAVNPGDRASSQVRGSDA
ncbi:GNAT family N-acetyltransferase [Nannocystaceae bacterium ST9]